MMTRMSFGLFFCVTTVVSQLVINIIMEDQFVNKMLFIPQTLNGLAFILLYPVSLEFTVAQSPIHMRGVMVGLWYTSWGAGKLISIITKFPFDCESQYICTSFYYYITKSVLVLIILIVFVILAKRYKYRVRENEVNIVQIVDDHYQRYMEQEEQYNRDIETSGVSVSLVPVSHSFFKHKLENISLIKNPIKLIVRVLCYARKHKYPQNRSALTYWEEEAPSRLDLEGTSSSAITLTRYACFTANIIQYSIDQLVGASADELNSVIYWHTAFIASGVSASLVLVSHSFFKHKLENISLIKNPIKLIVRVLCYARKHKYPQNRSALTYWEEEAPSRLDLVYLYFIRVCFYKYIPSMLTRISVGLFFCVTTVVSQLVINIIMKDQFVNKMLFIPQTLNGLAFILVYPVSLEFTVAQSPIHMRGVMVGLWYASWGIGYLISTLLMFPFNCESQYICTSFYYYIAKSVLVFIILIVFVILAKRYKYRVRENEVNIVQIVDDHYQRYMEQEEQYNKDKSDWTLSVQD
uniref:Major facilitator superfamily associated domain-containing protein n=1 Tax=Amphimedon queenslandica TaxID=400682 RepID=A0A1X7U9N6_AMPQE